MFWSRALDQVSFLTSVVVLFDVDIVVNDIEEIILKKDFFLCFRTSMKVSAKIITL